MDGRGNVYVNNIGFDFPGGEFAPGIIAVVTPDGVARQVADGVAFPNGMVVTPDNATLIVAESYGKSSLRSTSLGTGACRTGGCGPISVRAFLTAICLDGEGAVWYADVPNQRCVRVRAGGEMLQTVDLDRGCFACMLGGTNRQTLFLMAAEWRGAGEHARRDAHRSGAERPGAGVPRWLAVGDRSSGTWSVICC